MNPTQKYNMLILMLTSPEVKLSCFALASKYNSENFGRIDWHDVSDYLNHLHMLDVLKLINHDTNGACVYAFARTENPTK